MGGEEGGISGGGEGRGGISGRGVGELAGGEGSSWGLENN